jgi:hypothetical protein
VGIASRHARLIAVSAAAVALVVPIGVAGVAGAATTRTSAAQWSRVAAAPAVTGRDAGLSSIVCHTATSCMAVGEQEGVTSSPLVEMWDGTHWSKHSTPDLGAGFASDLGSVACAQPTTCFAVGATSSSSPRHTLPLIERWNGASWSVESVPVPPDATQDASLASVSCGGATSCTAVGRYDNSTDEGRLVEHWDGTSWSLQSSPSPSPIHQSQFLSVACASATTCTAVGITYGAGTKMGEVVEQWNGTRWSITSAFNHPGWGLDAVSCFDTWHCLAVGENLALRGEGSVWTDVSPSTTRATDLRGVSCTAPLDCVAVTEEGSPSHGMHWNGTTWQLQTGPSGAQTELMYGIACIATGSCVAVGYGANGPQAELLHGNAWSDDAVPDPVGPTTGFVHGVSCDVATHCVAVGSSTGAPGTVAVQYIADWNGTAWSLDRHPLRVPRWTQLESVSCTSAQSCVAVGEQLAGNLEDKQAVALVLQGGRWVPYTFSNIRQLNGVSCTSASYCVAVGYGAQVAGVAVQWNGTSWSSPTTVVAPNDSGESDASLAAVACTGASDCTAVGYFRATTSSPVPVVARLHAGTWHVQTLTGLPSNSRAFNAVACSSAARCVAVGGSYGGSSALVAESNGDTWQAAEVPAPQGATAITLNGVSCVGATNECWATGWTGTKATQQTALEHWDGTRWSYVPGPIPPAGYGGNELHAVTCVASGQCMTVGEDEPSAYAEAGAPMAVVFR